MSTAIWWVRRDIRLTDNQALGSALEAFDTVVPVFVLDPALLEGDRPPDKRIAFMHAGLWDLDRSLRDRGSRLVVLSGEPSERLRDLARETQAVRVFAEADGSPYARVRDDRVAGVLPLTLTEGLTVHPTDAVAKRNGAPYTVFTPYSRAWMRLPVPSRGVAAPSAMPAVPDLSSVEIPETRSSPASSFPPGEAEALQRLRAFVAHSDGAVGAYDESRDRLDSMGTSRLSPYLRFGMVSARQAARAAVDAVDAHGGYGAEGPSAWLRQLVWRDFYIAILASFAHVTRRSFRPAYDRVRWRNDEEDFAAWCEGRTGYPVVDASMRQLVATGWIHNRARMIAASFLVKDLLIDWRWGERFFMEHLIDGDPAANSGGWQWVAGTGTDAAPYFRVFNPTLQARRHDPDGAFARSWLPELSGVPDDFVHTPWRMPDEMQRTSRCVIDTDYPSPVVDHRWARQQALAAFAAARRASESESE